jgi:hypothetical protein
MIKSLSVAQQDKAAIIPLQTRHGTKNEAISLILMALFLATKYVKSL